MVFGVVVLEAVVFGSGAVVFGAVGLSGGTLDCNRDVELEVMAKFFRELHILLWR